MVDDDLYETSDVEIEILNFAKISQTGRSPSITRMLSRLKQIFYSTLLMFPEERSVSGITRRFQ